MFRRPRHPAILREVIVNLDDGTTAIRGVLYAVNGRWLTLRNAALLESTAERPSSVDGEIVIESDRVLFMQAV